MDSLTSPFACLLLKQVIDSDGKGGKIVNLHVPSCGIAAMAGATAGGCHCAEVSEVKSGTVGDALLRFMRTNFGDYLRIIVGSDYSAKLKMLQDMQTYAVDKLHTPMQEVSAEDVEFTQNHWDTQLALFPNARTLFGLPAPA